MEGGGSVAWEGSRASEGESGRAPLAQYGGSPLTIGSLGGYSPLGSDGERLSECVVVSISLSLSVKSNNRFTSYSFVLSKMRRKFACFVYLTG